MNIRYTEEHPSGENLLRLFGSLGWNRLNQTAAQLLQTHRQSWACVYAYDGPLLVGTGRVVSDGAATGFLCGLGVSPEYQNHGIGTEMARLLLEKCSANCICTELFCEEGLVPFYNRLGFKLFSVGMKKAP